MQNRIHGDIFSQTESGSQSLEEKQFSNIIPGTRHRTHLTLKKCPFYNASSHLMSSILKQAAGPPKLLFIHHWKKLNRPTAATWTWNKTAGPPTPPPTLHCLHPSSHTPSLCQTPDPTSIPWPSRAQCK